MLQYLYMITQIQPEIRDNKAKVHRIYLIVAALIVTSGVILGLFAKDGVYVSQFQVGGLRYFTYQSNILVAIVFVALVFLPNNKLRYYLSFCTMLAITVTGVVYNGVLSVFDSKNNPIIFVSYHNFVCHFAAMVFALVNYFVFEQKGMYTKVHLGLGIVFPLIYWLVFISLSGVIEFRPYFFMDPDKLNFGMLMFWLVALLLVFLALGFLLLFYDKKYRQQIQSNNDQMQTPNEV